ncbi:MAG: MATE family efflux transporter [Clostridia bacterium]
MLNHTKVLTSEPFFSRDRGFYKSFFQMMLIIALQNMITYSVNMADNVMLGAYDQTVLAGAAAVNQIQYILQQFTMMGLGEGLVILAGQYWGRGNTQRVQKLVGTALLCGLAAGGALTLVAFLSPLSLISLFTDTVAVQRQALAYLSIVRWTYLIFVVSNLLLVALRSMQIVKIAFQVSCVALVLNVCINYALIFGKLGMPEMGIEGAAIGTLIARFVELLIVLWYYRKGKMPVRFHVRQMFVLDKQLFGDFLKVSVPCVLSALLFSSAVAIQTVIFGHLSEDALAAASASGTLFQYCKMIPVSAAAAASVWISKTIGSGQRSQLHAYVRTLQVLFLAIGVLLCALLLCVRGPVLSLYAISPQAREYAMQMLLVQAIISIGMAYQMPCQVGVIRGGGDTRYSMISDLIYSWLFTVPLGLLSAFVWGWPFIAVTFCLNCDQLLKCLTVGIKINRYTWIRELAK